MKRTRIFTSSPGTARLRISAGTLLGLVLLTGFNLSSRGETPIFNGTNLDGWEGDSKFWRVEDGAIIGETTADNPTPNNTFLIWRRGEVDDFELKLRYRIASDQANAGIQFRSEDLGDHVVRGYQADIATEDWITGIIYEERGRGIVARRGQRVEVGDGQNSVRVLEEFGDSESMGEHIQSKDWNEYHIVAKGNHIFQHLNGHRMAEVIDLGERDARLSGILALQLHSGPPMRIEVKDIRLKRLPLEDGRRKVVMVAGPRSHGYGAHEHNAGTLLFKQLLDEGMPSITSTIYHNGWPKDPTAFDNANAILIYSNGGGGHPVLPHLEQVDALMKRGVGLLCFHYAVEVPKGDPGDHFLDWIGGYFETHWSVNPHWTLQETRVAPDHPITRGVRPYEINDEWYYHMRFQENMDGVTAILSATPPESTLERPDGPHSNNPHVRARKGQPQHLLWARERPDGGRGFGFTGGHYHWNWGHPAQRTLALNAIVWATGAASGTAALQDRSHGSEIILGYSGYRRQRNGQQANHCEA
jgi:type 1 glutamine amidotransferase